MKSENTIPQIVERSLVQQGGAIILRASVNGPHGMKYEIAPAKPIISKYDLEAFAEQIKRAIPLKPVFWDKEVRLVTSFPSGIRMPHLVYERERKEKERTRANLTFFPCEDLITSGYYFSDGERRLGELDVTNHLCHKSEEAYNRVYVLRG